MGTNYYARVIPTKKRKLELLKAIGENDFDKIKLEVSKLYGPLELNSDTRKYEGGEIHLGKHSGGWKFLWNPNIYIISMGHIECKENLDGSSSVIYVSDPDKLQYIYPLSKEGIWNFINEPNIEVVDEYGEIQEKEKFFLDAVYNDTWKGKEAFDSKSYIEYELKNNPEFKTYRSTGKYIDMLLSNGYKMISESNSDFYSDGLRFATCTDFR